MSSLLPDTESALAADNVAGHHYGRRLLDDLGATADMASDGDPVHPALLLAESGLITLTGEPDSEPVLCPVPLASCANSALDAFRELAGVEALAGVPGYRLLTERAAINGLQRNGSSSTAGHCRLLPTRDGHIGVNLPREDDWALLPAWLETGAVDAWHDLGELIATRESATLVPRGRELGLAVADAAQVPGATIPWFRITPASPRHPVEPRRGAPRVIDISSLWAGPLCSHLWQAAGAEVIKVESSSRPDGARYGPAEFFALLNDGKQQVTLDLHREDGQRQLRALIATADIVLEGSRPRALRQMGIVAEESIALHPGLTWVSISGYGRGEPRENWVAFGDDAAIAAGLSAVLYAASGDWLICGDAIADPLTGLHAALAGWASWLAGGGQLVALSLEETVRHCITATAPYDGNYRGRLERWQRHLQRGGIAPQSPRRRGEVSLSAP
jgi:crotonobetainyl-CoA:carnitine CoA-transferase CaiB-like acyl-CoA transferase